MAELPIDLEGRLLSLEPLCRYLAWDVCKAFGGRHEFDDLMQDAWLGAMDAVSRYDDTTGYALTTFAHRRVRGAIIDGIRERDHLSRTHRQRLREAGQTITTFSLDAEVHQRDHRVTSGVYALEDHDAREAFERIEDYDAVGIAVSRLPEAMRFVIVEYYWRDRTLVDISREMGVTESRVCQIIGKARDWLYMSLRDTYSEFRESPTEVPLRALA